MKNIVLLPSGNATYDMVCHCLFESDDVLLTNTPTYARNIINVSTRAQCELASVNVSVLYSNQGTLSSLIFRMFVLISKNTTEFMKSAVITGTT